VVLGVITFGAPVTAWAQACCAGSTALSPGRLNLHESELVGLQFKGTVVTGAFGGNGSFTPQPPGTGEVDFEEDLIASLRVLDRGQFTVVLPLVETWRHETGISDSGGGVGDLQVNLRWDATNAGASRTIPGIAVLASLLLPTGLPPEDATHVLSTDATGVGMVQGTLGLSLEQTFGKVLVNLTGSGTLHTARTVQGMHTELGPSFNAFAALGYSFDAGPVAALTASYTGELDSLNDGTPQPESSRTQLRFAITGGYAITDQWRIQGGVFADPPAAHFGENQPSGAGMSATLLRVW
jgi:hypothetical protein